MSLSDEGIVIARLFLKLKPKLINEINSKQMKTFFFIYCKSEREHYNYLNLENRIAEDEKLRNLS